MDEIDYRCKPVTRIVASEIVASKADAMVSRALAKLALIGND